MRKRTITLALTSLALAAASFAANAAVVFANLGTGAPPPTVGGHTMTPFDQAAQATVPNNTDVTSIQGSPIGGLLGVSPVLSKRSIGNGWATSWSHGYTGAVYWTKGATSATLTLPPNTQAFYFYTQPNYYIGFTVTFTVTTNSGTTSGAVPAYDNAAGGFAFYSTAGETISSITITQTGNAPVNDFAIGEFGISGGQTCASSGYTGTKLTWCQNVCEKGYTGATLNAWIRRWWDQYHTYPYCAATPPPPPPPPPPPQD